MSLKGLQLYSVREELSADYAGTVAKIAEMGYNSVEPAGNYGSGSVAEGAKIFAANNLKVISFHGPKPLGDDKNMALDMAETLGARYLVTGYGPADCWDSVDNIKKTAENFNIMTANASERGIKVACHNHYWEMELFDGVPAYRIFAENTTDDVLFELDTYWVLVGGLDPVQVVNELKDRAPLIHLKDGKNEEKGRPFSALNEGIMDMKSTINACRYAEALIVEQDSCVNGAMIDSVARSIKYLNSVL